MPMDMDQERIEIHRSLATIATDMKYIAQDLREMKDVFANKVERLEQDVRDIQIERKVEKAKLATAAGIAGAIGAAIIWIAERVIG